MKAPAPIALGLGVAAVAAIAVLTLGSGGEGARPASTRAGSTATVERQTLVEREIVDGTLGYAGSRTVINRLGPSGGGADAGGDGSTRTLPASYTPTGGGQAPQSEGEDPSGEDRSGEDPEAAPEEDPAPREDEPAPREDQQPQREQPEAEPQAQQPGGGAPSASPSDGSDGSDGDGSGGYSGSGTVTALPRAGSVVERGGALYRLDGDPVVLLYGSTPAYRALEAGVSDGRDVEQLERNLVALGFDPGTVDQAFSSSTAAAVSAWQESVGLEQTGSVELGRVVFQPGARRIGEHRTSVGGVLSAGAEVLDTSSTRRVVTVELDATLQSLAKQGAGVEVTLPDGSLVRGRIADVANVARELESSSGDPNAEPQLVVDLTVHLRSTKGAGELDEAPVGVGLARESRRRVLAVPVGALVARRGGGYGVELAEERRIVPVETGLYADGYVEVSGPTIRAGTRVVVPSE